jgi:ATP-binding cassette, subfamily B, bacterial
MTGMSTDREEEKKPVSGLSVSSRKLYEAYVQELKTGEPEAEVPPEKKPAEKKNYGRQYLALMWSFRWAVISILGLAVVVNVLETLQPRIIGGAIDDVLTRGDLSDAEKKTKLLWYVLITLGTVVIARALDSWRDYRTHRLNTKMQSKLRRQLFGHLLRAPLARLYELKTGGVTSRLTGDLDAMTGLVQLAFVSPVVALLRVIFAFVIVFQWNSRLALILAALIVPLAIGSFLWIGPLRKTWKFFFDRKGTLNARLNETFGGIRVVRAFQREKAEEQRYATTQHALARFNLFGVRRTTVVHIMWSALIPLANVAVLWWGGYMLLKSEATIGQITGLMGYTGMLMGPIWALVQTFGEVQSSLAARDRVFDQLSEPTEVDDPANAVEAPAKVEEIKFERVSFNYTADKVVLDQIDLTVKGGMTVALVGRSGSGKSTIADLVARFYSPTGGVMWLNGTPFHQIKLHSYRRLLGIVSQEVFLFDGTVAENLAYGRPEATREEIISAAKQANAHDFISEMAQGYDTVVGERGSKLSGGQRQRLSIARAIVADPQILILDEATSALDSESERLIQTAIDSLQKNRTTFTIAHRLSTIARADLIIVLEKGKILEKGTHNELMEARGRYWHMVEQQREAFE